MRSLYKLKERGVDQDLLREHVWGVWGRGDACQHDSYTCDTHPGTTGWPTRRLNTTDHNFFGAGGDNNVASTQRLHWLQVRGSLWKFVPSIVGEKATRRIGFIADT